ncbi:hypothetical protein N431DRAFT_176324 [Stipitochalara longipes BDJ]|nr:hypothetical protein N431DRAFT_176324 [Stipitochalara longipes BDJ]
MHMQTPEGWWRWVSESMRGPDVGCCASGGAGSGSILCSALSGLGVHWVLVGRAEWANEMLVAFLLWRWYRSQSGRAHPSIRHRADKASTVSPRQTPLFFTQTLPGSRTQTFKTCSESRVSSHVIHLFPLSSPLPDYSRCASKETRPQFPPSTPNLHSQPQNATLPKQLTLLQ